MARFCKFKSGSYKYNYCRTVILLLAILSLTATRINAQANPSIQAEKPNIIFILADDLGWGDLHCYGHPYAKTPSLDKLASEGTRFERFYVTGVTCNPSRTGFMTSRHPASYPNYTAEYGFADNITITELLNQNGYITGHFGKWHIGPDSKANPVMDGIYGIDDIGVMGSNKTSDGGRDANLFAEATKFIEQNKDKLFYVNIWGHITHYAVDPVASLVQNFSDVQVSRSDFGVHMQKQFDDCEALGGDTLGGNIEQSMRNYLGDVFGLDIQVGRLMDKLDELGLADNTIVIFSSDQGPAPVIIASHEAQGKYKILGNNTGVIPSQNMLGYAGGLRGGKHTQFEGGVRSPFIIRWPGHVPANTVNSTSIVSALDFLPTLCSITGKSIDNDQFEGEDMSDVWLGGNGQRTTPLFWRPSSAGGDASMLDGNWKIHQQGSDYILYDLSVDEEELYDVSQDHPEVVADMRSMIDAWVAGLPNDYQKDPTDEKVYDYSPNVTEETNDTALLFQHFDASVDSLVQTDAGNIVTSWTDISGNGYNALPGSGEAIYPSSKEFDNGLSAIDCRGSLVSLELLSAEESDTILNQAANPSGFCVITAVYIESINDDWNDILGNNTTISSGFFMRYSSSGQLQVNLGGVKNNGTKNIQPGQAVIFSFNYDAENGTYDYWCSATDENLIGQVSPADFSNASPLTVGSTNGSGRYFDGMVGEVYVFNTDVSSNQRKEIVYALGDKWGIELPKDPLPPTTRIVETIWSDEDVAIIQYNAAEAPYSADKTGVMDATKAIQHALDDCANAPGGVVYLPAGIYRINGNLELGDGVTLRGDWKAPTGDDKSVAGTILNIYSSKGVDSDDIDVVSPIKLGGSGGIRDLTIFYPEQIVSDPIPYPYTIRCRSKLQTVMNVTLVNSYKGIRYENTPTSSAGHPNVYNVYGSPIKMGIRLNKAAAVPRIVGVHFDPSYWAESGLSGAPGESEILNAQRALQSVALEFEQSDNGIVGDIHIKGYDLAIGIGVGGSSSNMKVYDFNIEACRVGVLAATYKSQGWTFTKGSIQADGVGAIAVHQTGSGTVTFNDVAVSSSGKLIVSSTGSLSLTNCHFVNWQDNYGIYLADGELISYGNIFSKTLESGQYNIYMEPGIDAAAISANTFENSTAKIYSGNDDSNVIVIDTTGTYEVYRAEYQSYDAWEYFIPAKEDVNSLFNVVDYGAVGDMETENSEAFKAALKAAGQYGGGTVYVPGGAYRIDSRLVIPTGVELRGVHDVPVYTGHGRSLLLSYLDENNPGDSAFITMEEGSGIRGVVVIRPQQVYNESDSEIGTTIHDWPFAIRAVGDNCSLVNIAIANADKGIDLASQGGGHHVKWYMTAPIRLCLNIQTGANPISVDNMQTNPGLFRDIKSTMNWSVFTDNAALAAHFENDIAPLASESQGLYPSGTAANIKGDGELSFYCNFYNNPFNGFIINGSPTMKSYLSGGEGEIFYSVQSEGNGPIDLEIIANTYHPIETDPEITGFGSFQLNPDSKGVIKVLNTTSFGAPNVGYRINNGNLIVQSAFQTVDLQTFVEADGNASASIEGCFLRNGITQFHAAERDDSASINIFGTYSENAYRVTSTVNVSGSTPLGVLRFDGVRPSTPLNLQALVISSSQIDLSWDASTDNFEVAGYYIYRDGRLISDVNATNYSDTGLVAGTSYSYFLRAFDAAKNASVASDTITVETLGSQVDSIKPTSPLNLVAQALSDKQIDLSWDASTDNVRVAGYFIYRDGFNIAATETTSYSDTGLVEGTFYDYFITAYDDANNESAASNTISISTLTGIGNLVKSASGLRVYPNPVKGQVFITVSNSKDSELYFELYTAQGSLVRSERLLLRSNNSEFSLNISGLTNGIYVYRFTGRTTNSTGRLLKRN